MSPNISEGEGGGEMLHRTSENKQTAPTMENQVC